MKKILISLVVMFLLVVWPGGGLWTVFGKIIGGGVAETFIFPIYGGMILLAGLITGCTVVIRGEIRSLKETLRGSDSEADAKHDG